MQRQPRNGTAVNIRRYACFDAAGTGSPVTCRERSAEPGRAFGGTPDGRALPALSPTEPTRLSPRPARAAPARLNRLSPGGQPSGAGTSHDQPERELALALTSVG